MNKWIWNVALIAAMAACGSANGQGCGTNSGGFSDGYGGGTNCGRAISQGDAEALWAGYCTETCFDYKGNRCSQRGRRGCSSGACFGYGGGGFGGGGFGGGGIGAGGCGVDGFDAGVCGGDVGCGTGGGCGRAGSLGGRRGHGCALFGGGRRSTGMIGGDGCATCPSSCFGYPGDGCGCGSGGFGSGGGGLGLFQHFGRGHSCRLFGRSAANCGANGSYFSEAVGHEYGTAGFQSSVAGCSGCGADYIAPAVHNGATNYNLAPTTAPRAVPAPVVREAAPRSTN